MDERRVADYFVVAGLPEGAEEANEVSQDGTHLKPSHSQPPITDVTVIFKSLGEEVPLGYTCITTTPAGHSANLCTGSWRSSEVFLCYKRCFDVAPLVDIGVIHEGKERIMADSKVVRTTPEGRPASVSSGSTTKTFVTFRRAPDRMPCNQLVVTDVCVIMPGKGELPPHAFCLIDKSLNKSLMGMSGAYICYKKSTNRPTLITYKPGVLARYPHTDRSYFPFPDTVPMFCLPMGATMECWPAEAVQPRPIFSTFVLTVADAAEKVYGSAVSFYEHIPADHLTSEQRKALRLEEGPSLKTVNVNKCICLLSHWPFFDTFEKFLKFLYERTCSGPQTVPVERYISHFLEDVPFPSPKRPRILVQLSVTESVTERVVLTQPEDLPLPRSGAGFCQLLTNLGPENCLLVLLLALTEQKVLVHSLRPDVLTAVAEAVSMIIFPFKWQCPYIPLCPMGLADVLHAPLPFLIGVDSRFFDLYDPPADVSCVDLDTNNITICEEKRGLSTKLLPKRAARVLRSSLQRLFNKVRNHSAPAVQSQLDQSDASIDRDFLVKRKEQALELEIQESFLHFMSSVLKGYRGYLLPIRKAPTAGTTDPSSLFDLQGFVRSRDKAHHKFFSLVMKTQMFIRFIEERSFVSDMDASLAFFDECAEKVDASDECDAPLLEFDDSQQSERTVFIMPPEPTGLPVGATYSYKGFVLNPLLFTQREMKHLLGPVREALMSTVPGSPVARRTKYEIRTAQKLARKSCVSPLNWSKYLLGTCHSLWFIHLPSHALQSPSKAQCLQKAYDLLVKINKVKVQPTDEVCYRVVMQLCGLYSLPVLAVKLLFLMKRSGMQPNAITYGFYNRAVLEAAWPSDMTNSSQLLWNKLRNVILGVALFRRAGRKSARRRLSLSTDNVDRLSLGGLSLESASSSHDSALLRASKEGLQERHMSENPNKPESEESSKRVSPINSTECSSLEQFRPRVGSIVKATVSGPQPPSPLVPFESSAGLLMSGPFDGPTSQHHIHHGERSVSSIGPTELRRHLSSSSAEGNRVRAEQRHSSGVASSHNSNCLRMLRSESFANDAQILEKLNQPEQMPHEEEEEEEDEEERERPLSTPLVTPPAPSLNGPYRSNKGRLGKEAPRSESQDLEQAVMDYLSEGEPSTPTPTPTPISDRCLGSSRNLHHETKYSAVSRPLPASRSPHSPARMPVTENDPLGALNLEEEEEEPKLAVSVEHSPSRSWVAEEGAGGPLLFKHSPSRNWATPVTEEGSGGPVLFKDSARHRRAKTEEKGRKFHPQVMRSVTYHQGLGTTEQTSVSEPEDTGEDPEDLLPDDPRDSSHKKAIQRSSTLPVSPSGLSRGVASSPSVASSLSSLSSSFKLPFRRYSPGRLSLRKADLRIGTQMLENAQNALTHFSPGSLAGKRSNELLMNLKSAASTAATSMVKKFDEIKEVISANATPVKGTAAITAGYAREGSTMDDDELSVQEDRRRTSSEFSPLGSVQQYSDYLSNNLFDLFSGDSSRKGSATNLNPQDAGSSSSLHTFLPERLYQRREDSCLPMALELHMTTCSRCHNCLCLMYDEEIMAGWVPDDSNLNTKCQFCEKMMVPFLTVIVHDFREQPMPQQRGSSSSRTNSAHSLQELPRTSLALPSDNLPSPSQRISGRVRSRSESQLMVPDETVGSGHAAPEPLILEPISVPYLNPLVLRKEVENILDNEGDVVLTRSQFVDEHPIIYWNLVWVFQRIDVESHLASLCLQANSVSRGCEPHSSWGSCSEPGVVVRCLWDNTRLHQEVGTPMYVSWQNNDLLPHTSAISRGVMQQVISGVKCNNLLDPVQRCATERHQLKSKGVVRRYSVYRDILFLAFVALGRENIDQVAFDDEYRIAFEKLTAKDLKLYQRCDQPMTLFCTCCRHFFRELEL